MVEIALEPLLVKQDHAVTGNVSKVRLCLNFSLSQCPHHEAA